MAINPMQRRARNSFITGLIVGLVITVIVAGLLLLQNNKTKSELNSERNKQIDTFVANRNIKSNSKITSADLMPAKVITDLPMDAIVTPMYLETNTANAQVGAIFGKKNKLMAQTNGNFGNENNANTGEVNVINSDLPNDNNQNQDQNQPQENQVENAPAPDANNQPAQEDSNNGFVAGIDIPKGTIITKDMLIRESDSVLNDAGNKTLRLVEYTSVTLPSQLTQGDTIDVRLRLKTGQDFLVITKKEVVKTDVSTVWLKVNEEEIARMASAIIEAYFLDGAKLYAVNYVRPGTQAKAIPTYPIRPEVVQSLGNNQNIPQDIKNQLNTATDPTRNTINSLINASRESGDESVNSGVDEEIRKQQENREQYLESLGGLE